MRRAGIRRLLRLPASRTSRIESEVEAELRFHVDARVDRLVDRGWSPGDARAEALRRLGNLDDVPSRLNAAARRRESQLAWRRFVGATIDDARQALRGLRRNRLASALIVVTLACGIGASAASFRIVDRLLFRPPAHVAEPERLFLLGVERVSDSTHSAGFVHPYALAQALDVDRAGFESIAAFSRPHVVSLGRGEGAIGVATSLVGPSFFPTFGARPALGVLPAWRKVPDAAESPVAVISYDLWHRRFSGDADVIGRAILVGSEVFDVVGVAPRGFRGVEQQAVDVWIPIAAAGSLRPGGSSWETSWGSYWVQLAVRLRADAPLASAEVHATQLRDDALAATGRTSPGPPLRLVLRSVLPRERMQDSREASVARLAFYLSALLVAMCCVNAGNVLLAEVATRRRETAVRYALGASRVRVIGGVLARPILLGILSGVAALGGAYVSGRALSPLILNPDAATHSIDPRTLVFAAAVAVVAGFVAGIAPAISASRLRLSDGLRTQSAGAGSLGRRLQTGLVTAQCSMAVVLLLAAGTFLTSLRRAADLDFGYAHERLLVASMDAATLALPDDRVAALHLDMAERVRAVPGVESVSISTTHPLSGTYTAVSITEIGRDSTPESVTGGPYVNGVSAEYFSTLGLRILQGRGFGEEDGRPPIGVLVIGEELERAYWPNADAIGRCVQVDSRPDCFRIIGIAADPREHIVGDEPRLHVYAPIGEFGSATRVLLVRTRVAPSSLDRSVRHAMQSVSGDLPYIDVRPVDQLLQPQLRAWRVGALVLGAFGSLAALITAFGLYGAVRVVASSRAHEFGVRTALGAQRPALTLLLLRSFGVAIVAGLAAGILLWSVGSNRLASLLFHTSPLDTFVLGGATLIVLFIGLAACIAPAIHATKVDPLTTLRAG